MECIHIIQLLSVTFFDFYIQWEINRDSNCFSKSKLYECHFITQDAKLTFENDLRHKLSVACIPECSLSHSVSFFCINVITEMCFHHHYALAGQQRK